MRPNRPSEAIAGNLRLGRQVGVAALLVVERHSAKREWWPTREVGFGGDAADRVVKTPFPALLPATEHVGENVLPMAGADHLLDQAGVARLAAAVEPEDHRHAVRAERQSLIRTEPVHVLHVPDTGEFHLLLSRLGRWPHVSQPAAGRCGRGWFEQGGGD